LNLLCPHKITFYVRGITVDTRFDACSALIRGLTQTFAYYFSNIKQIVRAFSNIVSYMLQTWIYKLQKAETFQYRDSGASHDIISTSNPYNLIQTALFVYLLRPALHYFYAPRYKYIHIYLYKNHFKQETSLWSWNKSSFKMTSRSPALK
jgi:hypothetical protein